MSSTNGSSNPTWDILVIINKKLLRVWYIPMVYVVMPEMPSWDGLELLTRSWQKCCKFVCFSCFKGRISNSKIKTSYLCAGYILLYKTYIKLKNNWTLANKMACDLNKMRFQITVSKNRTKKRIGKNTDCF